MCKPLISKKVKLTSSVKTYNTFCNTKKDVHFFIGNWNAKVGSQAIPGVTGKYVLGVQNEVGQSTTEFCQENMLVIANMLFQQSRRQLYANITLVNTEVRITMFFALKDDKLYTASKNKTWS